MTKNFCSWSNNEVNDRRYWYEKTFTTTKAKSKRRYSYNKSKWNDKWKSEKNRTTKKDVIQKAKKKTFQKKDENDVVNSNLTKNAFVDDVTSQAAKQRRTTTKSSRRDDGEELQKDFFEKRNWWLKTKVFDAVQSNNDVVQCWCKLDVVIKLLWAMWWNNKRLHWSERQKIDYML